METDTLGMIVILGMLILIMVGLNIIIRGIKMLLKRNESTDEVIGHYAITCEDGALTNAVVEFPDGTKIPMGARFEIEIRNGN